MSSATKYSPEVRERAVRLVFEHQGEHESQWAAIGSIASKIGCTAETLRKWVRQAERDQGQRVGLTSSGRERLKALEREVRELKPDAADLLDAGTRLGLLERLLGAGDRQRLLRVVGVGKPPLGRPVEAPIAAQLLEQPRAEAHQAVLGPLALLDAQQVW